MFKFFKKKKSEVSLDVAIENVEAKVETWRKEAPEYITSYDIEYYEDYLYVKLYYNKINTDQKNFLFTEMYNLFSSWNFLGVREYLNNRELCFTWRK